jgi:integrase
LGSVHEHPWWDAIGPETRLEERTQSGPGYDPGDRDAPRGRSVLRRTGAASRPERLRLYDLRHTCASLLIREGATVKAVQAQLGHTTASITLDTYGHLFPDELDQLTGRLEAARAVALEARRASQMWPRSGPAVVPLSKGAGQ